MHPSEPIEDNAPAAPHLEDRFKALIPKGLRILLAAQLVAMGLFMVRFDGSPLGKLAWLNLDTGPDQAAATPDLEWIEDLNADTTQEITPTQEPPLAKRVFTVDRWAGYGLFLTAFLLLVRQPPASMLGAILVWNLAWAVGVLVLHGSRFAFVAPTAQAVRWLLPLAALTWPGEPGVTRTRKFRHEGVFEWSLRIGIALTFATHGYEALAANPKFFDLILLTSARFGIEGFTQAGVGIVLWIIGVIDILVAAALLGFRSRGLVIWMAFWGFLTACSRLTALGWTAGFPETLLRAANGGVPLLLLFYWTKSAIRQPREAARLVHERSPAG